MSPSRTSRRLPAIGAAVIAVALAGGCAATPPGSANPSSTPPSPSIAPSASIAPSPTLIPATPSPTTPPSPSASALPEVGAAPDGSWSGVTWVAAGAVLPLGSSYLQAVFGWSRGYVAVGTSGGDDGEGNVTPIGVTSWSSADGLHWSAATEIDASGIDPGAGIEIGGVFEGPDGLLLVGYESPGACGGPPAVNSLWSSADGRSWRRIALPKDFRTSRVSTVDGGSAGFIASGLRSDGVTPGIWYSRDGATWHSAPVPSVKSGTVVVDGGTSFAGGYVLAGAVLGPEGCGGASSVHPSLWWSADGTHWTRDAIGGTSTANDAQMTIHRLSDHVVAAVESSSDAPELRAWVSTDGRTWTRVASPPRQAPYAIRTDGRNAVIVVDPESGVGAPAIISVDEQLGATELEQRGNGPLAAEDGVPWISTVGPTGVLFVAVDGSGVWLGVPS